jgi:hypothetical protein
MFPVDVRHIVGGAETVVWVILVVDAAGIMQEAEEQEHLRRRSAQPPSVGLDFTVQAKGYLSHPAPVIPSMGTADVQGVVVMDLAQEIR